MKEDILEQLVDDYLQARGYFTIHNLKFLPRRDHPDFRSKEDSNHSDIDVLGYHPTRTGPAKIMAVSCKSWQSGFNVQSKIAKLEAGKRVGGKSAWKRFRELMAPKWSEAFIVAVEKATGSKEFTYVTAVTSIKGDRTKWESYPRFAAAMQGNPIRVLTLEDMITDLMPDMRRTLAVSHLGRTLQLLNAAGCWGTLADLAIANKKKAKGRQRVIDDVRQAAAEFAAGRCAPASVDDIIREIES